MMNSKVMIGKDVLSKLNFEQDFCDCKSVLVIYDLQGNLCDIKYKLKKIFPKNLKVSYFKIKSEDYVQINELNKCAELVINSNVDMIVACGGEVACNMGKALKYMLDCGSKEFAINLSDNKKAIEDSDVNIGSNCESVDVVEKTNTKTNKNITLICVGVASGGHQNFLTGEFEVLDKKSDILYRMNKHNCLADMVMLDKKMFDKMSEIGMLGDWLGALFMALLAIANINEPENKANAVAAIDILSVQNLQLIDLVSAEMYAGLDFLSVKNNLLNEYILSVKKIANAKYSLILLLTMRKNIECVIEKITGQDISLLGCPFGIVADSEEKWKGELCRFLQNKIQQYFEDKDIPNQLNAIGLNSKQMEEIFDELSLAFGASEHNHITNCFFKRCLLNFNTKSLRKSIFFKKLFQFLHTCNYIISVCDGQDRLIANVVMNGYRNDVDISFD